jgi:hypothetical protein
LPGLTWNLVEHFAPLRAIVPSLSGNYFRDHFTFFANSPLPNFADISICNKSDLIIAFYSSAQATLMRVNN